LSAAFGLVVVAGVVGLAAFPFSLSYCACISSCSVAVVAAGLAGAGVAGFVAGGVYGLVLGVVAGLVAGFFVWPYTVPINNTKSSVKNEGISSGFVIFFIMLDKFKEF
jgi:hypothetical protein